MSAKVDAETGEILPVKAGDAALAAYREHLEGLAVEDPQVVQERILRNLLAATTAHDVLTAGEVTPAKDLFGMPLTVLGIRASESTFADGPEKYLHVDAELMANGDRVTFSCGASDVVMKLTIADMKGLLPLDCTMVQSTTPTAAGFYPVFLRELDPKESGKAKRKRAGDDAF